MGEVGQGRDVAACCLRGIWVGGWEVWLCDPGLAAFLLWASLASSVYCRGGNG